MDGVWLCSPGWPGRPGWPLSGVKMCECAGARPCVAYSFFLFYWDKVFCNSSSGWPGIHCVLEEDDLELSPLLTTTPVLGAGYRNTTTLMFDFWFTCIAELLRTREKYWDTGLHAQTLCYHYCYIFSLRFLLHSNTIVFLPNCSWCFIVKLSQL